MFLFSVRYAAIPPTSAPPPPPYPQPWSLLYQATAIPLLFSLISHSYTVLWSLSYQTTASLFCVFPYLPLLSSFSTRLQFFLFCVLPVPHCYYHFPTRLEPFLSFVFSHSYSMLQFLLYILHFLHTSLF